VAWAPHNLETAKEELGKHLQDEVSEELEDTSKSTRKPALLGYEELQGLLGIDPQVSVRKLLASKEEVRLLLEFLCNPTRTLPYNPTRTPTL
jgi:hypothetical protein